MSRRVMSGLLVLGACAALSCERPTGPTLRPTDAEAPAARLDIKDAVHLGGNPYFFFLPPLVPAPTGTGEFDASLLETLAVDVCVLSTMGCAGPAIEHFVSSSGTAPERISLNAPDHFYQVSWNTGDAIVDPARNYRIRVSAGSTLLGRIDVDVVPNAGALAAVDNKEFVGVVKGDWLTIRFRVDEGALSWPPAIVLPATLKVALGQDVPILVQLPQPAPAGGVTVTLASSDPGRVSVSTAAVSIVGGSSSGSGTLHGAAPGPATVTASATGYASATSSVQTLASLNIPVSSVTLAPTLGYSDIPIQLESMGAPVAAPSGIAIGVGSPDASCVTTSYTAFIQAGQSSTSARIRWGGWGTPLPCTIMLRVSAADIAPDSVLVTVAAAPLLKFAHASTAVGSDLENGSYWVQLATPAPPGGITVRLASADSTLLLLSPGFNYALAPGTGTLDVPVPAGSSSAFFEVQGVEGHTGTTWIHATAPGYAGDSIVGTVQLPAFEIVGLPASMKSGSSVAFQVQVGIEWPSSTGPSLSTMRIRPGGTPVTATITSSDAALAQMVTYGPVTAQTGTVQVGVAQIRSPGGGAAAHGIVLRAGAPGTVTVSATIPGWFPLMTATRTVTVTP